MRKMLTLINPRLRLGCGLLSLVILVGTAGFHLLERWGIFQAFYTTVLVVSTLGFSEYKPTSMASQLLTIGLIAGGVGTLYYLVVALAQSVIEGQLSWGKRRSMDQRIRDLNGHFIVCGWGRVGRETCRQIRQQGQRFVVIDNSAERVARIQALGYLVVEGDASDDAVLKQAGVMRAQALLTAVQSDAGNVYITLSARALNPRLLIVARAATAEAEHKLTIAGANRVISPYILGGRGMAGHALRPSVMELIDLLAHSDDLSIWLEEVRIEPGSPMDGRTIEQARTHLAERIVLAIHRIEGDLRPNPPGNLLLRSGDVLVVLSSRNETI